jgi:hypothetical protein
MTSGQTIILEDLSNFPINSYGKSVTSTQIASTSKIFEKPISTDYTPAADQDKYSLNTA